jgi:murein DD-endopeptidase MepM/ murein hydrolase activator NlpD
LKIVTRPERNALLLFLALLSGAGAAFAYRSGVFGRLPVAPEIVVASAPITHIADTLRSGETLSQLFERRGAPGVDWGALAAAVRAFNPSRVRGGTVFTFAQRHGESSPHAVVVRVAYDTRMHMERTASGWAARAERIAWRTEAFVVSGEVTTSVSDAITGLVAEEVLPLDSRIQLVWSLADVYDWTLDFTRDIRPGDRFRVLAERMVSAEGEVRYARILAAEIVNAGRPLMALRFDTPEGRQEFYDENGRSLRREFLRAPLEFRRIGSGFSRSRMHPILRYRRAHLGIDFGAAYGAPVRSVGRGTVVQAGRAGGYGNLVEIRHNASTTTRYAHLSGYARGIRAGARVEQGDIIGYVGASGLATAPHLHYELRINGRAVNPARRQPTTPGVPVPAARRDAFEREKARLLEMLGRGAPVRIAD